MNPYSSADLRKFYDSLQPEDVKKHIQETFEKNDRMFKEFIAKLNQGECFICGKGMDSFNEKDFCLHWFTYPTGIRKKYFLERLNNKEFSFFRMESYFRWIAEAENPLKNISDLSDEMSKNSYLESTIRYKNIEWSFSIGNTDLEGHTGAYIGERPHYHVQMIENDNIFIRFNDLHILFTDSDLFNIEFLRQNSERAKYIHSYGQGMSILENEDALKLLDEGMMLSENEEESTFRTETLIMAPEGKTISGDLIYEAKKKSKETKKPISQIMKEMAPDVEITKFIYPGDGVPEIAKRSGKK